MVANRQDSLQRRAGANRSQPADRCENNLDAAFVGCVTMSPFSRENMNTRRGSAWTAAPFAEFVSAFNLHRMLHGAAKHF